MSVVVIIPYYNESKIIERTLNSISKQTIKPNNVILVDSGSTDNSSKIINQWINKNKKETYQNIYSGEMSPSSSINLGIRYSEEKIIAYVDCGLEISPNWLESSLNQMNEKNSDMVSIKVYTSGNTIVDKAFIAQTYGFKNKKICLPGSLIKRNVFDITGQFLDKVRASYDTDFIKKFHRNNLKRSVNNEAILKYYGINYANSFLNGAKKVYSYSLNSWDSSGDNKPIIYISLTGILLITFFLFSKIFVLLTIFYLISRSILIPVYKSKKSLSLIMSYKVFYLFVAGIIIDTSRITAYIKSYITRYNYCD